MPTGVRRSVGTWAMTKVELARIFADHFGYTLHTNWLARPDGVAVACGWQDFADALERRGWIKVGSGVDWRRAGEHPRLPRVERTVGRRW